jgi:DnaJ family protein C protein 3
LLSTGQFNDAAKAYSEAIEQSPADYLLYYKRATAYLSLSRHNAALEDFDKVLSLTSNTFDNAHLMKARIYAKEGDFALVRSSIDSYTSSLSSQGRPVDSVATELLQSVSDAEKLLEKARKEKNAQLWTACAESCSSILRGTASHSIEVRVMRAECQLAAGDVEGSVGDLTRLAVLLPPSASMDLQVRIWRLSYFLLPPSSGDDSSTSAAALAPLKACLHFDPDSKLCLPLHRLAKALEKSFGKLEEALQNKDWRGAVNIMTDSGKGKEKNLWGRYEQAMKDHTSREQLLGKDAADSSSKSKEPPIPLPDPFTQSPRRQILLRALCLSYTAIGTSSALRNADEWCTKLMTMDGCSEDADALVGRAEYLLSLEDDIDTSGAGGSSGAGNWDEGIRLLEKAFEASGRSNRDIHSKLNSARKKVKQNRRKDYYKVLDVDRNADEQTIKKAFRRAAKTAHPDKGGSEAKMAAVNEAYEVLSDPELRARFDAGDDPNDPTSGHGGFHYGQAGNPFQHFFQQAGGGFPGGGSFGQGGFQFKWSQ